MQWLEISISLDREAIEAVAEICMRHGANGVELDDPRLMLERQTTVGDWDYAELPENFDPNAEAIVRAWLQIGSETTDVLKQIEQEIQLIPSYGLTLGSGTLRVMEIAEQNWAEAWKQYYKPLPIGEKLLIKPVWETWPDDGRLVIEMDPGLAFGTGNHATTRMCLEMLEKGIFTGADVIDVGCGSGILSIAAAKLGARSICAIDIDRLAVESTLANIQLNTLKQDVRVEQGDLLQVQHDKADIVLANIIADVIIRLLDDLPSTLKPDGLLICSGIISTRKDDVLCALEQAGFTVQDLYADEDWVAIAARSPKSGDA